MCRNILGRSELLRLDTARWASGVRGTRSSFQQGLILDCKAYLAPIVTPWEAGLALTGRPFAPERYRLDMAAVLVGSEEEEQSCLEEHCIDSASFLSKTVEGRTRGEARGP
jgi:hypothetical protein